MSWIRIQYLQCLKVEAFSYDDDGDDCNFDFSDEYDEDDNDEDNGTSDDGDEMLM